MGIATLRAPADRALKVRTVSYVCVCHDFEGRGGSQTLIRESPPQQHVLLQ